MYYVKIALVCGLAWGVAKHEGALGCFATGINTQNTAIETYTFTYVVNNIWRLTQELMLLLGPDMMLLNFSRLMY